MVRNKFLISFFFGGNDVSRIRTKIFLVNFFHNALIKDGLLIALFLKINTGKIAYSAPANTIVLTTKKISITNGMSKIFMSQMFSCCYSSGEMSLSRRIVLAKLGSRKRLERNSKNLILSADKTHISSIKCIKAGIFLLL